jgi:hypothetical protein
MQSGTLVSQKEGTVMRWFMLTSVLLAAVVSFVTIGATALAEPHPPYRGADPTVIAPHALVGSWEETTTSGPVLAVFGADGLVTMRFPYVTLGPNGNGWISGGTGTWETVGTRGATYSVVRTLSHRNGIDLGTITIQGYLVLSADGTTFTDDGQLTVVTNRNAQGRISSVTGLSVETPTIVATRVDAAPAASAGSAHFEAHGANLSQRDEADAGERTVPIRHNGGCNTCR